jgi:hypothetical protein
MGAAQSTKGAACMILATWYIGIHLGGAGGIRQRLPRDLHPLQLVHQSAVALLQGMLLQRSTPPSTSACARCTQHARCDDGDSRGMCMGCWVY